jgi:hypothetical protein
MQRLTLVNLKAEKGVTCTGGLRNELHETMANNLLRVAMLLMSI